MDKAKPFDILKRISAAEHREPCESRGSSTVLGAPGGEMPPGDSPPLRGSPMVVGDVRSPENQEAPPNLRS